MPWYRLGEPGHDGPVHLNFGRSWEKRKGVAPACVAPRLAGDNPKLSAKCFRMAVALCDAPAGQDLDGQALTCSAPMCEKHRTRHGARDYCTRHAHLAPAPLPLEEETAHGDR